MNTQRKVLVLAGLSILASLTLIGCSSQGGGGAVTGGQQLPAGTASTNLKGVTLTMWHPNTMGPGYSELIAGFEKKTGAKIQEVVFPDPFESNLETKWATGARPDILMFQSVPSFYLALNPRKNMIDLTNQKFTSQAEFDLNKIASNVDGKSYGVSLEAPDVYGIWYNKKVVSDAGISAPPTSFADFKADLEKVKANVPGVSPLFDAGGDKWPTQVLHQMLWADPLAGGLMDKLNKHTAKWTDPDLVKAFTDYQSLYTDKLMNPDVTTASYAQEEAALLNGKAGYIAQGGWVAPDLIKQSSLSFVNSNIGWFPISTDDTKAFWGAPMGLSLPATGNAKREQAALAFLQYSTGSAYQGFVNTQNQVPALKGFKTPTDIPAPVAAQYVALSRSAFGWTGVANIGDLGTAVGEVMSSQITSEAAAQLLDDAWVKSAQAEGIDGF